MRERIGLAVKDKVQHHHRRGLVTDVLGVDGAALFPDSVCKSDDKGAGTGGGVIASDVLYILIGSNQQLGHNHSDGVGRIVFCVCAASICIIVVNQVLKDRGEKVVSGRECAFETCSLDVCNQGFAEVVLLLRSTGDEVRDRTQNGHGCLVRIHDVEHIAVVAGNLLEGGVEESCKIGFVLVLGQEGNQVVLAKLDGAVHQVAHLVVVCIAH